MARTYGDKFLRELNASEDTSLGIELARSCVAANLPAAHVALALNVSRLTVSKWFRGQQIRAKRHDIVKAFIRLINGDLREGILPAANYRAAKKYIESLTGTSS
jgi:hypothetical protein